MDPFNNYSDERLSGLCKLSLHRKMISDNKDSFIEKVINKFGEELPRRLQFLFQE